MKNIVINPFDSKSIQNAINELNKYNSDLTKKCEQFVKELADVDITSIFVCFHNIFKL